MATERCSNDLDVSNFLFRLATQCVRLHSNDTKQLASLGAVIAARAQRAADGFPGQEGDALRGHLETMPTAGDIRIEVELSQPTAEILASAQQRLAELLGMPLTFGDTISVILFDYSVDRAAASMLDQLIAPKPDTSSALPDPTTGGGFVIPLR